MKAFVLGIAGFVFMAAVAYGGFVAYNQVQKERIKEAILSDLACQSPLTQQRFGIQCAPSVPAPVPAAANASPPAPKKE